MFTGTKNFSIKELENSETARKYKIDNSIPEEYMKNAEDLLNFLQGLRDAWGSAIVITSGYRCKRLNMLVGGVASSAHTTCNAADLQPKNGNMEEFKKFCVNYCKMRRWDQLLLEKSGNTEWVHFGLKNNSGMQRCQIKNLNE